MKSGAEHECLTSGGEKNERNLAKFSIVMNFEISTCEVYVRRNNRKIFFIRFAYGFILSKDIELHFVAIALIHRILFLF